jgi:hypothetical protein
LFAHAHAATKADAEAVQSPRVGCRGRGVRIGLMAIDFAGAVKYRDVPSAECIHV